MNDGNNNNSVISIGFTGLLALVFIILKLCGVIAWSWWWVLAPLWVPVALVLLIVGIVFIAGLIVDKNNKPKL